MITEDYVGFETAKLLKEKGFDEATHGYYPIVGKAKESFHKGAMYRWNYFSDRGIAAPTLQMATKWLRENFNINPVPYATSIGWYFEVFDLTQRDITGCALLYQVGIPSKEKTFETCEEACEAGIRYCLENLI